VHRSRAICPRSFFFAFSVPPAISHRPFLSFLELWLTRACAISAQKKDGGGASSSEARRRHSLRASTETIDHQNMKTKILSILILTSALAFSAPAQTSTATPAASPPAVNPSDTAENNFVSTMGSWVTSIDYAKTWPTNGISFSVGALWQNNIAWANYITAQKDAGNFCFDTTMANQGIAGTIERVQAGGGYRLLNRGDLAIYVTGDLGYARKDAVSATDPIGRGLFFQPQITLRKLMAHGAFAEMSLNYDVFTSGQQPKFPGLKLGTGFTF
jgi:hypothetical protein